MSFVASVSVSLRYRALGFAELQRILSALNAFIAIKIPGSHDATRDVDLVPEIKDASPAGSPAMSFARDRKRFWIHEKGQH